jgi:hypothetical protein
MNGVNPLYIILVTTSICCHPYEHPKVGTHLPHDSINVCLVDFPVLPTFREFWRLSFALPMPTCFGSCLVSIGIDRFTVRFSIPSL